MPSNHLIFCHPLLLLPSFFPSIKVFSNELPLHIRWPEYWSFSFSISSFNEYSGLISLKIDWLDLPAVQGTLKSLIQHHHSKASVLQCSVFFMIQHSHPYMNTGKTIALTRWTFIGKVMSLLFNMLSRFGHSFSSKEQVSFNFMAAVIICSGFGVQENKVCHCFHCFPTYLPWSDGADAIIFDLIQKSKHTPQPWGHQDWLYAFFLISNKMGGLTRTHSWWWSSESFKDLERIRSHTCVANTR